MKFPGKRKTQHYFPVGQTARANFDANLQGHDKVYVVGLDQLIVDIEAQVSDDFLSQFKIKKGESVVVADGILEEMYLLIKVQHIIVGTFAGGATGNTLHNYSVLSDDRSVALGAINAQFSVGDDAFKYLCSTNSHVDFSHLMPVAGNMARALCLITPDGERSFAVGKGIMNELREEFVPESVIAGAGVVLASAYLLRDEKAPMFKSFIKTAELCLKHDVPLVLSLGTSTLVSEKKEMLLQIIKKYVSVLAMNRNEGEALTAAKACFDIGEIVLDICDLALITDGARGLFMAGHVDDKWKRETKLPLRGFNQYEYSRAQRKKYCSNPLKIYTHIDPFLGGPEVIKNTNGAGDAALSAVLHDLCANVYHRLNLPESDKHRDNFLSYSSIHQVSKYANRVSYEILNQSSPRLLHGLPMKDESLEDGYWDL
jgi:inosine kinase